MVLAQVRETITSVSSLLDSAKPVPAFLPLHVGARVGHEAVLTERFCDGVWHVWLHLPATVALLLDVLSSRRRLT